MFTSQSNSSRFRRSRRNRGRSHSNHHKQHPQQKTQEAFRQPARVNIGEDYYDEEADAIDRDNYYASVKDSFDDGDAQGLYRQLNRLIGKNTRQLSYKQARRHLYAEADRRPDGGLYYLYSGDGPKNEEEVTGPATHELSNYNCEHVVPQSWFNKRSNMKSDMHHLFTEEIQCNGSRGNYPLDELPDSAELLPDCGLVDHDGRAFEPKSGKGAVARATMYFLTRYPGKIGDSRREYQKHDMAQLLEWHREYPVTDYERHRNDVIEDVQGNRNPYIDFPELAEAVDFNLGFG